MNYIRIDRNLLQRLGLTHDSFPSSLWIPKSTITRDHQSSTLHWNLLFQQCVENTLHVVGQIPLAKSFLVLSLVTCWRTFDQNVSLANLFVCSRVARLWPDCSLWDPKNQQRQWMSEGTGSFKIALREQSARFVSEKKYCSLDLLTSSIKSIYCRSTKSCLLIYQVPNSVDPYCSLRGFGSASQLRALHKNLRLLSQTRSSWLLPLNRLRWDGLHGEIPMKFHHTRQSGPSKGSKIP